MSKFYLTIFIAASLHIKYNILKLNYSPLEIKKPNTRRKPTHTTKTFSILKLQRIAQQYNLTLLTIWSNKNLTTKTLKHDNLCLIFALDFHQYKLTNTLRDSVSFLANLYIWFAWSHFRNPVNRMSDITFVMIGISWHMYKNLLNWHGWFTRNQGHSLERTSLRVSKWEVFDFCVTNPEILCDNIELFCAMRIWYVLETKRDYFACWL